MLLGVTLAGPDVALASSSTWHQWQPITIGHIGLAMATLSTKPKQQQQVTLCLQRCTVCPMPYSTVFIYNLIQFTIHSINVDSIHMDQYTWPATNQTYVQVCHQSTLISTQGRWAWTLQSTSPLHSHNTTETSSSFIHSNVVHITY